MAGIPLRFSDKIAAELGGFLINLRGQTSGEALRPTS